MEYRSLNLDCHNLSGLDESFAFNGSALHTNHSSFEVCSSKFLHHSSDFAMSRLRAFYQQRPPPTARASPSMIRSPTQFSDLVQPWPDLPAALKLVWKQWTAFTWRNFRWWQRAYANRPRPHESEPWPSLCGHIKAFRRWLRHTKVRFRQQRYGEPAHRVLLQQHWASEDRSWRSP